MKVLVHVVHPLSVWKVLYNIEVIQFVVGGEVCSYFTPNLFLHIHRQKI
jgi:hypothetical protein